MLYNVATGESTAVTEGGQLHADPVWSPDGNTLAYVHNDPRSRFHIYTRSFDNGSFGEQVRITEPNDFGRGRLYFGRYDDHIQPTFSPDGKEIILVSNRGITLGSGAIWRAPLEPDAMSKANRILREETLYRTQARTGRTTASASSTPRIAAASTPTSTSIPCTKASRCNSRAIPGTTSTRPGRPTANGSLTSRTSTVSPSSACSRPSAAPTRKSRSSAASGAARWAASKSS